MKISDYIVNFFEEKNLTHVFMVTGGSAMHLNDSFGKSKKIKYFINHHEQASAMAAEAYTKYTNKPSIVMVSSGPAATNTLTGLLSCYQDSTPVVFISGQCKSKESSKLVPYAISRQLGVQEANIIDIVKSITKYSVELNLKSDIKKELEKAYFEATSGRPGPVWISVPLDVQSEHINFDSLPINDLIELLPDSKDDQLEKIGIFLEKLKKSKRPLLILGNGIRQANANNSLERLLKKIQVPFVTSYRAIDSAPSFNHLNYGCLGIKGNRTANFIIQNSDLILALGTSMSITQIGYEYKHFARDAEVFIVDIDPLEHKKNTIKNISKIIELDLLFFLDFLNATPNLAIEIEDWLKTIREISNKLDSATSYYGLKKKNSGIDFYSLIETINKNSKGNEVFIADSGTTYYVASQSLKIKLNQRYILPSATGTMGFCIPAALGVYAANNESKIVVITGEGSIMQNLQELQTLVSHSVPALIILINNRGYNSIRQSQIKYFNSNFVGESEQSGLSFPDFKHLAKALNIDYSFTNNEFEFEDIFKNVISNNSLTIIEALIHKDFEVEPVTSNYLSINGTLISRPLEDMHPLLDRKLFNKLMIVKPLDYNEK